MGSVGKSVSYPIGALGEARLLGSSRVGRQAARTSTCWLSYEATR